MRRIPSWLNLTLAAALTAFVTGLLFFAVRHAAPLLSAGAGVDERAEVERYSPQLGKLDADYRQLFRAYRRDQLATASEVTSTIESSAALEDRNRVIQALRCVSGLERFKSHEDRLRAVRDQLSELPPPSSPTMRQVFTGYVTAYNTAVLSASAMAAFPQLWQDSAIRIASTYANEADTVWRKSRQDLTGLESKYRLPATAPQEPVGELRQFRGSVPSR